MGKHWTATGNFILIEKTLKPTQTESGIALPANAKAEKVESGTVIAYGPDAINVKTFDIAFFESQYAKKLPGVGTVHGGEIVAVAGDMVVALQRDE